MTTSKIRDFVPSDKLNSMLAERWLQNLEERDIKHARRLIGDLNIDGSIYLQSLQRVVITPAFCTDDMKALTLFFGELCKHYYEDCDDFDKHMFASVFAKQDMSKDEIVGVISEASESAGLPAVRLQLLEAFGVAGKSQNTLQRLRYQKRNADLTLSLAA